MDSSESTAKGKADAQYIDLVQSTRGEWLKLPVAAMCEVGSAAQTLGGLLKLTNKETFTAAKAIAAASRLPLWTCRKHLDALAIGGWIKNLGREHTRRGAPRRTCTIVVTAKARHAAEFDYGILPWWACCKGPGIEMPWSSKAVLSIVVARLAGLVKTVDELDDGSRDEVWGSIENLGGDFRFSLDSLTAQTGLSRKALIVAKADLHGRKIVKWSGAKRDDGGTAKDELYPNDNFGVVVTPASEGRCYIAFSGG